MPSLFPFAEDCMTLKALLLVKVTGLPFDAIKPIFRGFHFPYTLASLSPSLDLRKYTDLLLKHCTDNVAMAPLSSASETSSSFTASSPVRQPSWISGSSSRGDEASGSEISGNEDNGSQSGDDTPLDSQLEIPDSFESDEDLLTKKNSLMSDGSESSLSSLASRTPTPPSSPSTTLRTSRDQHGIRYRPRLPHCECDHWCHCERYEYFHGGIYDITRHVDEDRQPIDRIQPWRVPNQQHLSNTLLDAEVLPESSMRSTFTPAYGHDIKPIKPEREDQRILLGEKPEPPKEPIYHLSDGTQRFSWEDEGYGMRAPHRWQGDSWRGALSKDGSAEVPRAPEGQWLAMSDRQPVRIVNGKRKLADQWGGKAVEIEYDGRVLKRMKAVPVSDGEGQAPAAAEDEMIEDGAQGAMTGKQAPAGRAGRIMGDPSFRTARQSAAREVNGVSKEPAQTSAFRQATGTDRSVFLLRTPTCDDGSDEAVAMPQSMVDELEEEKVKLEDDF